MGEKKIVRALVSVSDKTGVAEFAARLAACGIEILSTGGTASLLKEKGIAVTSVDSYTGSPEIMHGRVKTLHPKIHGGILAIRDNPDHLADMEKNSINPIDLVAVNLYPFRETVAKPGVLIADAVENIDIGGPSMIRSTAKNHAFTTIVVDPADYAAIATEIEKNGSVSKEKRQQLAVKAFGHTASYDAAIHAYLEKVYS